ncbi:DoxX family protein [Rhodococcus aerolatus]
MLIRRIARPMLAAVFVAGGVDTLRNPAPRVEAAKPLVAKGVEALPDDVTDSVPTDADTLVKVNAAVQVGGGLLLASGKLPRLSSLALAGTLVPTTLAGHAFWEETDPAAKAAQRTQFLKNVSLLGGLIIAAVDTEGKPSLGWRGRQAAKRANQAVTAAVPFVASHDAADTAKDVASRAADASQELAHRVAESDTTKALVKQGRKRGHELAGMARERGEELAELAKDRGPVLAERARERGAELAEVARDRAPVLADAARDKGAELADRARDLGSDYAAQAEKATRKQRKQLAKQAKAQAKDARKRGSRLVAEAQSDGPAALRDAAERAQARAQLARARAERVADRQVTKLS